MLSEKAKRPLSNDYCFSLDVSCFNCCLTPKGPEYAPCSQPVPILSKDISFSDRYIILIRARRFEADCQNRCREFLFWYNSLFDNCIRTSHLNIELASPPRLSSKDRFINKMPLTRDKVLIALSIFAIQCCRRLC